MSDEMWSLKTPRLRRLDSVRKLPPKFKSLKNHISATNAPRMIKFISPESE